MSSATIALNIVATNMAGSAFGAIFTALSTLGVLAATTGTGLAAIGDIIPVVVGAGAAFALFSSALETAVDDAAALEYQLARLQNATGATDAEFSGMRQNIEDVAGRSVYSTTEVTQAFTVMANNLIPVGTIIGGLGEQAIVLSEAMGTDAVSGAKLLTQAFKVFSDQGYTGQQMIDMLTRAFHEGMPDVAGIASLLGAAGGNADAMGVSMRDLLAVADVLAPSMGSVSQAGTSLNYMLKGITDPTTKAYTEFQKLGLILSDGTNTFYDAQGNFIGLANAIDKIKQSLAGMTKEEKANALDELFNVRSGQGARILTNLQDFKGQYDQIFADLGRSGAADEAAQRLINTWQGRLNELRTNIQSTFANIGRYITGPLTPVLGHLADLVGAIGKNPALDSFLGMFLLAGTVLTGVTLIVIGLMVAFTLFAGPILAAAGVAAALTAGAGALGGILLFLHNHAKQVHGVMTVLGGVMHSLGDDLKPVGDKLGVIGNVIQANLPAFQTFLEQLHTIWNDLAAELGPAFQQFGDALGRIKDAIPKQDLDNFLTGLKAIGGFIVVSLIVALAETVVWVVGLGAAIVETVAGLIAVITSAAAIIADFVHGVGAVLNDLRTGHLANIKSDWNSAWTAMGKDTESLGNSVVNTMQNVTNTLTQTANTSYTIGTSIANGLVNGFSDAADKTLPVYRAKSAQMAGAIGDNLKFQSPPKEGPLSDSDKWGGRLVDLITTGMDAGIPSLRTSTGRVATAMVVTPAMQAAQMQQAAYAGGVGGVGGAGAIEVPVYLDGKEIARSTFDVLKGKLQAMGMSRLFK